MSEPDLIQEQRRLIRAFRQATQKRVAAEVEADNRHKRDLATATSARDRIVQLSGAQFAEVNETAQRGKKILAAARLPHLYEQSQPVPTKEQPDVVPSTGLTLAQRAAAAQPGAIEASIQSLNEWHARQTIRRKRLVVLASLLSVGLVALAWWGLKPCRALDSLVGRPSGCLRALTTHTDYITDLTFSTDGHVLMSVAANDDSIKMWNSRTGKEETIAQYSGGPISNLDLSPDDGTLAVGGFNEILIVDTDSGRARKIESEESAWAYHVAFLQDNQRLISAHTDGSVRVWDTDTRRLLTEYSPSIDRLVDAIALSTDRELLAIQSRNEQRRYVLHILETGNLQILSTNVTGFVSAMAFVPNSSILAFATDGSIKLWDTTSGSSIRQATDLFQINGQVSSLSFSLDGMLVACAYENGRIELWNVSDRRLRRTYDTGASGIRTVVFGPDGQTVASAGGDRLFSWIHEVRLWEVPEN